MITFKFTIDYILYQIGTFGQITHILDKDISQRAKIKLYFLFPWWIGETADNLDSM